MGLKADNAQIGQSSTASQNFNIRAPSDGTLRLERGNAGTPLSEPLKIEANNDVRFAGNVLSGVLGMGQAWQEVTASRAVDITYTNTSGKPIQLSVLFMSTSAANTTVGLFVNGVPLYGTHAAFAGNAVPCVPAIIPPGATYVLTVYGGTATLNRWSELR